MTLFEYFVAAFTLIETFFLILIWRDGKEVLKVERATHSLYGDYIADRREERHKKLEQLAAARAAKAAKKEMASVETTAQN
jgi:hypothetical protein